MNITKATSLAKRGARIRRAVWDSCLIWKDGALHWDLPVSLLKQCYERADGSSRYAYWGPDEIATDWVAEEIAAVPKRRAA